MSESDKKPELRGLEEVAKFLEKKRQKELQQALAEALHRRAVIRAYKRQAS